jgi:hypothetical protein
MDEEENWNELGRYLNYCDIRLASKIRCKTISKKEQKRIKGLLNKAWIRIWEIHPDQHPELTKLYKLHFEEKEKNDTKSGYYAETQSL